MSKKRKGARHGVSHDDPRRIDPAAAPTASPADVSPSAVPAPSGEGWLGRWAFGPVAAVRPYLAVRIVLWILALDVWSTHLGAAWRYGTAGFNVAHFGWMDALPIPTTVTYVGMLALVSVGAAAAATMAHPPRALIAAVALLYAWGWSSSMHDSYQHHYLLSWMLVTFAAVPSRSATDLFGPPGPPETAHWLGVARLARLPHGAVPRTHAWGFRLVTMLPAVVYGYTAISKLEPEWRSGQALRAMTDGGEGMETPLAALSSLGIEGDAAWTALGGVTIAIQIVVSLAYATAPLADLDVARSTLATRWRGFGMGAGGVAGATLAVLAWSLGEPIVLGLPAVLALGLAVACFLGARGAPVVSIVSGVARGVGTLGMIGALAFHHGAEAMGLEIGWFSYYMMALAVVVLGPAEALGAAAVVLTAASREATAWARTALDGPLAPIGLAVAALIALAALGDLARAPGALPGLVACGVLLLALAVAALARVELRSHVLGAAVGAAIVAGLAMLSLSRTEERYDYFRFAGGDFRRRGEVHEALEAYREALPLAPTAEDRERIAGRIEELEALDR